jgi:hypothetical protein
MACFWKKPKEGIFKVTSGELENDVRLSKTTIQFQRWSKRMEYSWTLVMFDQSIL